MAQFTRKHTNIAKGIGISLMLWHHLFYNSPEYYDKFRSLKIINGIPVECYLADICKVCVAVFLFLSGYGLYQSWNKAQCRTLRDNFSFVSKHLIAGVYTDFWFIYLVFVPLGFLFGRNPVSVYQQNPLYFLKDVLGLSYLFDGWSFHTMNDTWWFMSVIIVFYLVFPLFAVGLKKFPESFLAVSMFASLFIRDSAELFQWQFAFVLGIYFSVRDLFPEINRWIEKPLNRFISIALSVITLGLLRIPICHEFFIQFFDGLFVVPIILFSAFFLSEIKYLGSFLEKLGRHSGKIFMFHSFLFYYYFPDLFYRGKYAPLIFLFFLLICFALSCLLDKLQKLTHYKSLFQRI